MKNACEISPPGDDWAQKGFHLVVLGEELKVYSPDGKSIEFESFFNPAFINTVKLAKATKMARQFCLSDARTRKLWRREAGRAVRHLRGYNGPIPHAQVQQRIEELKSLQTALKNYDNAAGRA